MLQRFYAWAMDKAMHRHALAWLAVVSFIESSIFPIPPDIMLIPMVLAAPTKWFRIAMVCTLSSVAGGYVGYAIGYFFMGTLGMTILDVFHLTEKFYAFKPLVDQYGVWVIIVKGATPIPYKLITIAAGAFDFDLLQFTFASFIARAMRFFLIAALLWKFGPTIRDFIEKRLKLVTTAVVVLILLVIAAVKLPEFFSAMPVAPMGGAVGDAVSDQGMEMGQFFAAVFLGLLEGLTEFLPISSTGHLILAVDFLAVPMPPGKTFEIVIQLGAIVAVCLLYWRRLWRAAADFAYDPVERTFVRNILIAFFPAMVIGALAYPLIKRLLSAPEVVPVMLVLGGIAILGIERMRHEGRYQRIEDFSSSLSLKIGLFQVLSMIPGVSRSGATIMGALLVGIERRAAAEFSFFLAIPTMLGAAVYSLYKNWNVLNFDDAGIIATGFVVAMLTALSVVRLFLSFVSRHGFAVFAWYRIVMGGLMMVWMLAR